MLFSAGIAVNGPVKPGQGPTSEYGFTHKSFSSGTRISSMATANFTSKPERVLVAAAERNRDAASMAMTGLSQSARDPEILATATEIGGIARRAASCR